MTLSVERRAPSVTDLRDALAVVERFVAAFEPGLYRGADAVELVDIFSKGEHVCTAGKTLAAARVEETNIPARVGDRDGGSWLARRTGNSVGRARDQVETARRLRDAPKTDRAFRSGRLSPEQAKEAAATERVDPESAEKLIEEASELTGPQFRQRAERIRRGRADEDEAEAEARLHHGRRLRMRRAEGGAGLIELRTTPQRYAELCAAIEAEASRVVRDASRAGRLEPFGAHRHDAPCNLILRDGATGEAGRSGPNAEVKVRVDVAALRRGWAAAGETCEIDGVGPVSVATGQRLLGDSLLKILVTKGKDVRTVANGGRTVPAALRTALEERDPVCVVDRCNVAHPLEIHHHRTPFCEGGEVSLANAGPDLRAYDDLVTYRRFTLEPKGDGRYRLVAPDEGPAARDGPEAQDEDADAPGRGALF